MVAGHVVPLDPVRVEVVEDGEAGLGAGRVLASSAVVGLGQAGAEGKQKYLRRRAKIFKEILKRCIVASHSPSGV